jgi:acetyl-CoA acetyltransferase family protein
MKELHGLLPMGETAEEVATRYRISRERQDEFALRSHRLADAAWNAGHFDAEVLQVTTPDGTLVARDECIRPSTSLEKLAGLKPVFRKGGSVTAGNSSPMNDGAAGLVLASERGLELLGVEPLARYVLGASAGVHPDVMGIGPIPAVGRVLERSGWKLEDVETAELNEAFAAQALAVVDDIGIEPELVNPSGGAIAIGHPLGCSGARIVTTLVHRMHRMGLRRGLAAMCVGVGQGTAVLIEGI